MELQEFLADLKKEIQQKLHHVETAEKEEIKRLYGWASILLEYNAKLKEYITEYEFRDIDEEIHFFKYDKPALVSKLIYYCDAYNILITRPVGSVEKLRLFLHGKLEDLQDYIDSSPEFYSYYRLGVNGHDTYYFTRGQLEINSLHLDPSMSERDSRDASNCDYKLAKIQANEQPEIRLKAELE